MNPVVARVVAGGLAGCLSTVVCFPLDVVRTFLTVQTSGRQYDGALVRLLLSRSVVCTLYEYG